MSILFLYTGANRHEPDWALLLRIGAGHFWGLLWVNPSKVTGVSIIDQSRR
jgi:hypothetical protein